jgi:hypothetical protein
MKKLLLLLPLLLVFVLAGCVPFEAATDATEEGEQSLAEDALEEEKTGFSYTDTINGFALTLPETWAGFDVRTENIDWGNDVTAQSFYFGFETWDDIFAISVINKVDFEKIEATPNSKKIGESNKNVFLSGKAQAIGDEGLKDRWDEVTDIIKTFELK